MTKAMPFLQKYDITFLRPPSVRGVLLTQLVHPAQSVQKKGCRPDRTNTLTQFAPPVNRC